MNHSFLVQKLSFLMLKVFRIETQFLFAMHSREFVNETKNVEKIGITQELRTGTLDRPFITISRMSDTIQSIQVIA